MCSLNIQQSIYEDKNNERLSKQNKKKKKKKEISKNNENSTQELKNHFVLRNIRSVQKLPAVYTNLFFTPIFNFFLFTAYSSGFPNSRTKKESLCPRRQAQWAKSEMMAVRVWFSIKMLICNTVDRILFFPIKLFV